MATMTVLDSVGAAQTVEKPLPPGRAAAASSRPVALSTEDAAFLDGIEAKLDSVIAAVDGLETLIGATNTAIGATNTALTAANASLDNIEAAAIDTTTDSPVSIHQPCDVIAVTPTLDTSIYASGDVLFTTTAIANAVRANDGLAQIQSLVVIDKDDQKPELALKFWSSNVTYGTINAVPSISDADGAACLGRVNIVAADYDDDGGVSTASIKNIGLLLKAGSGSRTIWVTGKLTAGTPTHTASGLVIRLGLVWS